MLYIQSSTNSLTNQIRLTLPNLHALKVVGLQKISKTNTIHCGYKKQLQYDDVLFSEEKKNNITTNSQNKRIQ